MNQEINIKQFSPIILEAPIFSSEVLEWIAKRKLWNLWVPKTYNGLELPLSKGLKKLQTLAKTDGSLGWTVTLCSGANYFIGNLHPEVVNEIFLTSKNTVCFGGSGGAFGGAERQGNNYIISGEWHYATGAPYLTHFTLNAKIIVNGKLVLNDDKTPLIYSFIIPKKEVTIIENWDTMGLKATATHSFKLESAVIASKYAFVYNQFYLPQPIFKIPFSVFADLTLWVNYLGMAEHFLEEGFAILEQQPLEPLLLILSRTNNQLYQFAEHIEKVTTSKQLVTQDTIDKIHLAAVTSVSEISKEILNIYPLLGVKASREPHPINQIFRDYFTATQHHIFSRK